MSEPDLAKLQADLAAATKASEEALAEAAKLRKANTELSGKVMTPEQQKRYEELEAAAAKAEEDRAKKAGEYDKLAAQLTEKHTKELETERTARTSLESELRGTLVGLAFAGAGDLFGKDGKTIMPPEVAEAYFNKYVDVQTTDSGQKRVVVKNTKGEVILDPKTGHPAAFAPALAELIEQLPIKDQILRGSGKTGSGNSGGSDGHQKDLDLDTLIKKAATGDPEAVKQLRARQQAIGGQTQGSAFKS